VGSKKIKRGPGKRAIAGKDFNLADEIRYIQREPLNTMAAGDRRTFGVVLH